jgi:GT2 family glycosyltransferase
MEGSKKTVSLCVIVLNYNDYETTSGFLNCWLEQNVSLDWKVIVVDNDSSDDSFQRLSKEYNDRFDVIQTGENRGYGSGNNFGYQFAIDRYHPESCVICNPDIIVETDVVAKMQDVLMKDEECAVVGCKLVGLDGIVQRYAWKLPTFWYRAFSSLLIINRIFLSHYQEYKNGELEEKYAEVEVIVGAFFIVKCSCFENTFLFDEETFLYGEEEILGYRLKQMGKKLVVCNELTCIHLGSESIKKSYEKKVERWKIAQKSGRILLEKYMQVSGFQRHILDVFSSIGLQERLLITRISKNYERKN